MAAQNSYFTCTEVSFMQAEYMIDVFGRENCVKIRVLASIPSLFERRMAFGEIYSTFLYNIFFLYQDKFINKENEGKNKEKIPHKWPAHFTRHHCS